MVHLHTIYTTKAGEGSILILLKKYQIIQFFLERDKSINIALSSKSILSIVYF